MQIAKRYQDDLQRIKDNVKTSHDYFKPNFDRYHAFRKFIFKSSLTQEEKLVLKALGKPELEFNMSEAYISRLRGEFAKQEPSLSVNSRGNGQVDAQTLEVIEGHTRSIMFDANNDSFEYEVYTDLLSGGFSVMKVWTDFASEMAFDQDIKIGRVFDPTLCGFDVIARLPHKGDGSYCFENFPKTVDQFKEEFGSGFKLDKIQYIRDNNGFNWSYRTQKTNEEILLVCDYYEKKKKEAKIVQLANGQVMTATDYEEFVAKWQASGRFEQPPTASRSRKSLITTICRTRLIENQVIEYEETDYKCLPLIFVDGNSVLLRDDSEGTVQQMTRPYLYHAKDQQRLINFAGQTLANELENMTQSKWIMPIEGLPDEPEYVESLLNNQQGNIILFNAYRKATDQKPLPPPREVMRAQTPPEVINTFMTGAQNMQSILGSFDASMGDMGDNDLSGKAILEAATQSNAAAMPYIKGFLQGLNQVAQIIVDLIPKYYVTPRSIPYTLQNGKKGFVPINQPDGVSLNYDSSGLDVRIEPGVNFNIQKSRTLQQIVALSNAMPVFGNFMNSKGLKVIVKNLEGHAMDELEEMADQFMKEMQQAQAKQQQQLNPLVMKEQNAAQALQLKQQEIAIKQQEVQSDAQLRTSEIMNDANANTNDRLKIMLQAQQAGADDSVEFKKAQAEEYKTSVALALQANDQQHKHALEIHDQLHRHTKDAAELTNDSIGLAHQIEQANKPQPTGENKNV